MKILLFARKNIYSKFGGDSRQLLDISKIYNRLGHKTFIATSFNEELLKKADIIHLFNLEKSEEHQPFMEKAKELKKKILLTPVYKRLELYNKSGRFGISRFVARLSEFAVICKCGKKISEIAGDNSILQEMKTCFEPEKINNLRKELLASADFMIFSSEKEKELLSENYRLPLSKTVVIPNFIDTHIEKADKTYFKRFYPELKDFILMAGRIEALKNQSGLLEALKGVKLPLVFIGDFNKKHILYNSYFLLKKNLRKDTFHFTGVSSRFLFSAMKNARVHVLPSWFELIGLSTLEAAYLGCNTVSTSQSFISEYFKDSGIFFCSPDDFDSIKQAVLNAYNSRQNSQLKKIIEENYSLDKMATLYKKLIGDI